MARGPRSSSSPARGQADGQPYGQTHAAGQASSQTVKLCGFHAVRARLRVAADTITEVWVEPARKDQRIKALVDELQKAGITVKTADMARLDGLAAGQRHQGVVGVAQARQLVDDLPTLLEQLEDQPASNRFLLFLDGVTDPHNLGAIMRTADAAGVAAVVAPKDHSAPLNDVVMRVAAGGADRVPYIQVTNLSRAIEQVQDAGYQVYGLDGDAEQSLYKADLKGSLVLVMGAEGDGIRRLVKSHCDALYKLPMKGGVESLNVSVATGVACFEALRQRS
jgi:23S rRNA (guanosine2251-2'-O)-methyltransferase